MIRPEVWAAMVRWREALIGLAILTLGAYWFFGGRGLIPPIGAVTGILGGLLILAGVQRGRFRRGGGGFGVVQLDEGEVTYFGPISGGTISAKELRSVELEAHSRHARNWLLTDRSGNSLNIPVNAEGADAMFDVFVSLAAIDTERLLSALDGDERGRIMIWQSNVTSLH